MTIVHQQQPTPYTCNQACLAMLLNVPVEEVIRVFPNDGMTAMDIYLALDRCQFIWNALLFGRLPVDGLYLLTVPSLNMEAQNHCILVELLDDNLRIYDPNRSKPGRRWYSADQDGGVMLRGWSEPVLVRPPGRLPEVVK